MTQTAKSHEIDLGDGHMRVTRTSVLSGETQSFIFPITNEQFTAWKHGALIQEAMPDLLPWQREFLMTGIADEEWKEKFPSDE